MKTMAAKNPIAALRKEGSPLYDKIDRQRRRAKRKANRARKNRGLFSTNTKTCGPEGCNMFGK